MTSRERVLCALRREVPDRVPWIEGIVETGIAGRVCGKPIRVDWSVAPDGFPRTPGAELAEEQRKVNRVLGKDNLQFSAFAPIFAHRMTPARDAVKSARSHAVDRLRSAGHDLPPCLWDAPA